MKFSPQTIAFAFVLTASSCLDSYGQNKSITYAGDTVTIFANPERGWYDSYSPPCCDKIAASCSTVPVDMKTPHGPLTLSNLQAIRNTPEKMTLYRDIVKISQYGGPIPQSRLDDIQADLNTARKAGVKVLFRIIYNYGLDYGEPCASIIDGHLDQLKPILQSNSDVIFTVQAGLYGGSGEACCNSFLLGENNNGWSSLNPDAISLYKKLFAMLPADRSMVLRYPRYVFQMNGWSNSATQAITAFPSSATPLTAATAYNGSMQSRLGYMQDNFAGDVNGYGFFDAWGQKEIDFVTADTKYALMEGELSWGTDYNKANGAALMERDHYTTFHNSTHGGGYEGGDMTFPAWKANGMYDKIGLKLGYRFRLINSSIPQSLSSNAKFTMTMTMKNDGWARIVNPRNVEIIFKNKASGTKYAIKVDGDGKGNRLWLPGEGETKVLNISSGLPSNLPLGAYDLFLNLPDPYASLHDNPLYSVRLANTGIWDETTGYNSLLTSVDITGSSKIASFESNLDLEIVPNPAKNALSLSGKLPDDPHYEITSIEGKILQSGVLRNGSIPMENFTTGMYFIKIQAGSRELMLRSWFYKWE